MLAEKVISVRTLTQIITPSTHSPQGMNEELKMFLCMHNSHTKTVGQKNQVYVLDKSYWQRNLFFKL